MLSLAFHKVNGRGFFGRAIQLYEKLHGTNSEYSHVELVLRREPSPDKSWVFSSDETDGGTRFTHIDLDSTDWTVVDLAATHHQVEAALYLADNYNFQKYDWLGIVGLTVPWGAHDDDDKFCSEVVTLILQLVYGWWPGVKPWRVTPGGLYDMVMALPKEVLA